MKIYKKIILGNRARMGQGQLGFDSAFRSSGHGEPRAQGLVAEVRRNVLAVELTHVSKARVGPANQRLDRPSTRMKLAGSAAKRCPKRTLGVDVKKDGP